MAYTQNESIDGLTAITPTTDDIVVTMDQAEIGVAKTSTLLSIYNLFKTTYDTIYAKYLGDADFYKYQITTSIAGGNLTVTLLNYLGATPSASAPVKIQIGGVVRTITSAFTKTINSGTSYLNLGSAELATKEVDLFFYVGFNSSTSAISMLIARFGSGNIYGDFTANDTSEKGRITLNTSGSASTDPVVNIGRFNAILSAGAGYTWSIPATSVIVNSPIRETRILTSNANPTGMSVVTFGTLSYQITGSTLKILGPNSIEGTSNATTFTFNLPFSSSVTRNGFALVCVKDNSVNLSNPGHLDIQGGITLNAFKTFYGGGWTASGLKAVFISNFEYQI